jgi:hypothetical protein
MGRRPEEEEEKGCQVWGQAPHGVTTCETPIGPPPNLTRRALPPHGGHPTPVREQEVTCTAPTYRGETQCFSAKRVSYLYICGYIISCVLVYFINYSHNLNLNQYLEVVNITVYRNDKRNIRWTLNHY